MSESSDIHTPFNPPPTPPSPAHFGSTQYGTGPAERLGMPMTNSAATAAMVFAILGTAGCPPLFAPLALGFGLKGRKAAEQLGGEGAGKATFGIVRGVLGCVGALFLLVIALANAGWQ